MVSEDIALDLSGGALFRGGRAVGLRPKTLAVLAALIERQGEVVSQDDLRRMVWGSGHGSQAGPKQCIRELRHLIGVLFDDGDAGAGLIETEGRRGYRLTRPIPTRGDTPGPAHRSGALCVGRQAELEVLLDGAEACWRGHRALALVAGEAGAGKTRLLDAFTARLPSHRPLWVARGQAIVHPGAREPYGLLLDALAGLSTGPEAETLVRHLRRVAPSWAGQISGAGTRPQGGPVDTDTMRHEFSDLMERMTRTRPGVLVLEDLHWADPSTLAWLAQWGMQQRPSRLMVIGTYRDDALDRSRDLADTLRQLSRQPGTRGLTLGGLSEAAVSDYLRERFPGSAFPTALAGALARRTEGHAILVESAVEHWLAEGAIRSSGDGWELTRDPDDLAGSIAQDMRSLIEEDRVGQLDPEERTLLEVASVAGPSFSAIDLADDRDALEEAERQLEHLARNRRFIEHAGVSRRPDGTHATRYAFRHALHHEALYAGMPAANRQGTHRRIGLRLEAGYRAAVEEVAPVLADHFERGADWPRAVQYRTICGERALARGAVPEAAQQFRTALDLCRRQSHGTPSAAAHRATCELRPLLGLGAALIVSDGFISEELRTVYRRASALAMETGDVDGTIPVLAGIWNDHVSRADLARAGELAANLQALSSRASGELAMAAHNIVGQTHFFSGALTEALPQIRAALAIRERGPQSGANHLFGEDPEIVCHQYAACVHEVLGQETEAESHVAIGRRLAEERWQLFGLAQMHWGGAVCARLRGDVALCRVRAEALTALCRAENIPFWSPTGLMLTGWARAMGGDPKGAALIDEGLAEYEALKVRLTLPFSLGLAAEAAIVGGAPSEARRHLRRAMASVRGTGERWYHAELHRLRARLLLSEGRPDLARLALQRALQIALAQGAAGFEARAARQLREL